MAKGSRWLLEPSFSETTPTEWAIARRFVAHIVATAAGTACDGVLDVAGYGDPEEDGHGASSSLVLHRYVVQPGLTQEDARSWLDRLVALHRLAAMAPIPNFAGLAVGWAKAVAAGPSGAAERDALHRMIKDGVDPAKPDKDRTDTRQEQIVFGDEPDIASVERAVPAILEYHQLLASSWSPPQLSKNGFGKVTNRPYFLVGMVNCAYRLGTALE